MSSHNNNLNITLSNSSITEISQALYIIWKHTEHKIKSITFQNNIGVLNIGGGPTNRIHISLPSNMNFQLVSQTELDDLNLEIANLKVYSILTQLTKICMIFIIY
jgi:hypothetical protein